MVCYEDFAKTAFYCKELMVYHLPSLSVAQVPDGPGIAACSTSLTALSCLTPFPALAT